MSNYEERHKDRTFKVTRWCCTSGNCVRCQANGSGLQKRQRCIQLLTDDKQFANRCFRNYRDYGPILFERTKHGWSELRRERTH